MRGPTSPVRVRFTPDQPHLHVYGKLGDLYGRKRVFLVSILVFLAGSADCGLPQTMTQLIAGPR
ncbi:hypothetical protein [Nonomuraea bangladeshensis]|uniref:hypothetical protein n=1 Tax=Nonomuraea bangladeshensis TaxID=404385 RepID=UPI003C2E9917